MDNSGAKLVKIIRLLGGNKKRLNKLGDIAVVAVKIVKKLQTDIMKGEVRKMRILRAKHRIKRKDGFFFKFDNSGGVILNKHFSPAGSRIKGPLIHELRRKFGKFTSLGKKII